MPYLKWFGRWVGHAGWSANVKIPSFTYSTDSITAWTEIQSADIWDPVTLALDTDILDAMESKIAKAIRDRYGKEFQNAQDANLVALNQTVSVLGSLVTISGTVNWRPYGYTNTIALTFNATR